MLSPYNSYWRLLQFCIWLCFLHRFPYFLVLNLILKFNIEHWWMKFHLRIFLLFYTVNFLIFLFNQFYFRSILNPYLRSINPHTFDMREWYLRGNFFRVILNNYLLMPIKQFTDCFRIFIEWGIWFLQIGVESCRH